MPSVQIVDIRLIPWTTRWCFPLQCRVTISIWCEYGLSKVLSSITSTPLSCSIIRFASLYSAPVWWGCLSNNRLTESWAIGSDSFGKHRDASEHVHAIHSDKSFCFCQTYRSSDLRNAPTRKHHSKRLSYLKNYDSMYRLGFWLVYSGKSCLKINNLPARILWRGVWVRDPPLLAPVTGIIPSLRSFCWRQQYDLKMPGFQFREILRSFRNGSSNYLEIPNSCLHVDVIFELSGNSR